MLSTPASRLQFTIVRDIDAAAARVFEVLTSEAGMKTWVPMCRTAVWRHPPGARSPGPGSVRHIVLDGGILADERILAWEPGRELHYSFDRTTLPIAGLTRNYVGVTRVEPLSAGRSRLTWAIHFDAPGALALLAPALRFSLYILIGAMAGKLARAPLRKKPPSRS